ncbi:MAG: hypothetical protein WCI11_05010 [Candidatus Methylumidiphilus sp.]
MTTPTTNELTNASMAFLAYTGQFLAVDPTTVFQTAASINKLLPNYPNLNKDWAIVWGPALYCTTSTTTPNAQANLTFVAQSLSSPNSYIVATRGTVANNKWEWLTEDIAVSFEAWPTPAPQKPKPHVSSSTFTALSLVLNTVPPATTPGGYSPLPGAGQTLADYLASIAASGTVNISFTGHSLGGAIAPALALWFKQAQGTVQIPQNSVFYPMPAWDVKSNATISCVSLAGATPGDKVFSGYFQQQLGSDYDRIYNTNDTVPYGFAGLGQLPGLYLPTLPMTTAEKAALTDLETKVTLAQTSNGSPYCVLPNGNPFTCALNTTCKSFAAEALYQHIAAYEQQFGMPISQGV